jgi:hypothetical protein
MEQPAGRLQRGREAGGPGVALCVWGGGLLLAACMHTVFAIVNVDDSWSSLQVIT